MAAPPARIEAAHSATDVLMLVAVVGLLGIQAVHVSEHAYQVTAWVLDPVGSAPLTRVAVAGRDALAPAAAGDPTGGIELLHLLGNVLFLAGLGVLWAYLARHDRPRPRALRLAVLVQGAHVIEHGVLTGSWFVGGEAVGLTTGLGAIGGTAGVGTRVVAHALLNLVPSALTVLALHQLRGRPAGDGRGVRVRRPPPVATPVGRPPPDRPD